MPITIKADIDNPGSLGSMLKRHLLEDVMSFWEQFAIDEAGGINTCLADDGTLKSRDKWLWSQWRAVWVFSELYRCIEARPRWLELAYHIYHFCSQYGWDRAASGWAWRVNYDGQILDGYESIYVDCFAIYGLTALHRATGDPRPLHLACTTAHGVLKRLEMPHDQIPHAPYPIPHGARVHGIAMMCSQVLWELGEQTDNNEFRAIACRLSDEIFQRFYRLDRDVILERIAIDGSELPSPVGTVIVPGHVIEDMWFQIHIARARGDTDRVDESIRLMRRHLELGWDDQYGGILLAIDADGGEPIDWHFADMKLWWPHTEAMYGLLLCYDLTGDRWAWDWYCRVHRYALSHFPVHDVGEWRQRLDRRGTPVNEFVALPVKDPFHLPRALILSVDLLKLKDGSGSHHQHF